MLQTGDCPAAAFSSFSPELFFQKTLGIQNAQRALGGFVSRLFAFREDLEATVEKQQWNVF
jgi:hypothetical protein